MSGRTYVTGITAGCFQCKGSDAIWTSANALGVAARHHQATGHTTWCDRIMVTRYGDDTPPRAKP